MNHFTFGGISSATFEISADREIHSVLPEQRKYQTAIPMRDGVIDFGIGGYGTRILQFDIYFDGSYPDLRASIDNIAAWLTSTAGEYKELSFEDAPNRHYMAKLTQATDFQNTKDRKIGTLVFECNPPWAYGNNILLTPEQINWTTALLTDNQYTQTFNAPGNMRFTLTGNQPVKPVIKLLGYIPPGLKLTCGAQQWQYNALLSWDMIVIDCDAETVNRGSDGGNLYSNCNPADFFTFSPGNIEISVTGVSGAFPKNLTVIVNLEPALGV